MDNLKLLLVYPDFDEGDRRARYVGGNYSEGLASISAVVKAAGFEVALFHMLFEYGEAEFKQKIASYNAGLIGFSIRTTIFGFAKSMVKWTREACPDAFVFAGGYHITLVPDDVIGCPELDAVCIGEGELPTRELMEKMRGGQDYTDTESFYFRLPDGRIKRNAIRPLLEDLDELPPPDIDLFDYANLDMMKINTALVMISRGCIFSCTYCGNSQFRNVYPNKKHYARFRSAENALNYIETLLKKYPSIEYLNFRDATFNMFPQWFEDFIVKYRDRIHKPFSCNLRLDLLSERQVRLLSEAGCYMTDVGLESGDAEIRTKYLKRMMTDEQIIRSFSWFAQYGITSLTYNIVGLPYEDLKKTLKTIKLNARINPNRIIANIFYPYPETVLHDIAADAGFVPDEIPADCRVPLLQKQYPRHEVLFASCYFMNYIKLYRGIKKLPRWLGRPLEACADFTFTGPLTPRRFLVWIHDRYEQLKTWAKRFLRERMPKLYLAIRNRRHRKLKA